MDDLWTFWEEKTGKRLGQAMQPWLRRSGATDCGERHFAQGGEHEGIGDGKWLKTQNIFLFVNYPPVAVGFKGF